MSFKLAIVTPEKEALAMEADEVVAPGINGEVGLLPGHVPLITALRPGLMTVHSGGKKTVLAVSMGYAEVDGDTVTILTDSCEASNEVDLERAKAELAEAQKKLDGIGPEQADFALQQKRLMRAQARIDAANSK